MLQQRLYRAAPVVMHLNATWVESEGWNLSVIMRRQDECWDEAYRSNYTHLTTSELGDVIMSESAERLGLA